MTAQNSPRKSKLWLWLSLGLAILVILIVVATAVLIPQETHPAYASAVTFVNAASRGEDDLAHAELDATLTTWVAENCPDGSVSACVDDYVPDDWGALLSAVYRRSAPEALPDGRTRWHVDVIATYERGTGGSGVCTYIQMDEVEPEAWRVTSWAGWVHCGDPSSRNMAENPDAPNRAP